MSELLGCWTCNLVVPGSSPPPCLSLELFSVAPISTPRLLNLAKCGGSSLIHIFYGALTLASFFVNGLFYSVPHVFQRVDSW